MVKDQEYLENQASYCLDLAKKLGAKNLQDLTEKLKMTLPV